MQKLTGFTIAVLILAAAAASAQPGQHGRGLGGPRGLHGRSGPDGGGARHMERVTQRLDLTEEQQARWQEIASSSQESLQPLFDEAQAIHEEAQALMQSDDPEPAALGQLHLDARAIHEDIATSREILHATLNDLLTVDQQEAWEEMRAEGPRGSRRGPRDRHRRGGQFGGGPPA